MPTARTLTRAHTSQGRRETLSQAQRAQRSRGAQAASLLAAVEGGGFTPSSHGNHMGFRQPLTRWRRAGVGQPPRSLLALW